MIFQSLDDKIHCIGIYCEGELVFDEIPTGLTGTWNHVPRLDNLSNVEYAKLYCGGKTLNEVCPERLQSDWSNIQNKLKAFVKSFRISKVSFAEHCFYDLVPKRFLLEYCEIKNRICEHVFKSYTKPENYDFMVQLSSVVGEIESRPLNIDKEVLRNDLQEEKYRRFWKKLVDMPSHIRYNIHGTKTGRLTTTDGSFPILTMDKDFRKIIKPQNDWFVELDFNAAELRTFLALSGHDQPQEDLHEWNRKNIYNGEGNRDDAKKRIFAWLYNPESKDKASGGKYDRNVILNNNWDGKQVLTPFGRKIDADKKHALNYIVQSTTSDILLNQMIKINELLKETESHISFCIHDNVVIDMKEEDYNKLSNMVQTFADTKLGKYKVNVRIGKSYGDMKEINYANL